MWSHMLPMTVVVMSHIMSICPSTAAPQNLVIPSSSGSGSEGMMEVSSGSWEDEASPTQKESNALLQKAFLLSSSSTLGDGVDVDESGDMTVLMNTGEIPSKSTSGSTTGHGSGDTVKVFKRSGGIRHQYEFDPWTMPTGNRNGNDNEILLDGHQQTGSGSGSAPGTEELSVMIPTYFRSRLMKRSPRCLRRCLAQGLLHPSQCHSLC